MKNFVLEQVTLNSIEQLQKICSQTFCETNATTSSEKNINEYLAASFSVEKLTIELSDYNSEFYFATIDSEIIAYLKINFGESQTELQDDNAIEIERIYVLNRFQGQKVGQIFFNKAVDVAKERNAAYIWLAVWEKNLSAIGFYKKNGFEEFDKRLFKLSDDEQIDLMLKLRV
ncbi:ribosomal protein S18 acetylase RimI-like enzyme [Pedobacter sp. UYEF25]